MRAALKRDDGQALTEYALVIGLLALISGLAALTGVGQAVVDLIVKQIGNV
jgi:Flp pilus assembly pilin Flp